MQNPAMNTKQAFMPCNSVRDIIAIIPGPGFIANARTAIKTVNAACQSIDSMYSKHAYLI